MRAEGETGLVVAARRRGCRHNASLRVERVDWLGLLKDAGHHNASLRAERVKRADWLGLLKYAGWATGLVVAARRRGATLLQSMLQTWTALQHNGPDDLGFGGSGSGGAMIRHPTILLLPPGRHPAAPAQSTQQIWTANMDWPPT